MKRVGIVGATGAVGREVLEVFETRKFPVSGIVPFASPRSLGKPIRFSGRDFPCKVLEPGCFSGLDLVFFDASDAISKEWVDEALRAGCWVIDNSATYRMADGVPLLVPEVNASELDRPLARKLVAGPNCTVAPMVVALQPVLKRWGLERLVIATYQSTSGAGSEAMKELREQTAAALNGQSLPPRIFAHPIAFNCIPQIGGFKEDGTTSEEQKTIFETRKILGLPDLRVSASCVRVPTLKCHGLAVNVETKKDFDLSELREAIGGFPGISLQDDPKSSLYPQGLRADGKDPVFVGRIRRDTSLKHGFNFWIVSDNLRKGAALNGVQIAEELLHRRLL